jgi:hypothetical protein
MRYSFRIDLAVIEEWLAKVESQSERQRAFVESVLKAVADARAKNDFDIVLDVDDDIVLCRRYNDGREVIDTNETPLYYAQCIALGVCNWDEWR